MNKKDMLSSRIKSFEYAINGLKIILKDEYNFRIHLIVMVIVLLLGYLLKISTYDWAIILLSIGLVLTLEIINTTIENICNLISKELHPEIKKIKDIAAASVLVGSIISLFIGMIIFLPRIFEAIHL